MTRKRFAAKKVESPIPSPKDRMKEVRASRRAKKANPNQKVSTIEAKTLKKGAAKNLALDQVRHPNRLGLNLENQMVLIAAAISPRRAKVVKNPSNEM